MDELSELLGALSRAGRGALAAAAHAQAEAN